MYIEMTLEDAEKFLKNSKNKKVLVAVQNLEEDGVQEFTPRLKEDCLGILRMAATLAQCSGDVVNSINAFSEKQNLKRIKNKGVLSTILINVVTEIPAGE